MIKKKINDWTLEFSENDEEYVGHLTVFADTVVKIDKKTIEADGIRIVIDEYFIGEPKCDERGAEDRT